MNATCKFLCEAAGCKSTVELSDADDLKNPGPALKKRGWLLVEGDDDASEKHYCAAHKHLAESTE